MFKLKLDQILAIILFVSGFLACEAKITISDVDNQLFKATESGNLDTIKQAINNGANVNSKDDDGWTPLMKASGKESANIDIIQFLLEKGANVNNMNFENMKTALTQAAQYGQTKAVIVLLLAGADINHRDVQGYNAHDLAIDHGHSVTALVLQTWPEYKGLCKK